MRRRQFIRLMGRAAAAWPIVARGQQPAIPIVGYLGVEDPATAQLAAFRSGLNEQGYDEGRNVVLEFRNTSQYGHLPELAAELVRRRVAVIFAAGSNVAATAAKSATATIPIVFLIGGDPVTIGLVASFSRPGGNVTGVTNFAGEVATKRLELLREIVQQSTTIAFLVNPTNASSERSTSDLETAAHRLGQQTIVLRAGTASEIETAFTILDRQRVGGLFISADAFFFSQRNRLIALLARQKIPAVHFAPEFTQAGGLMSYSDDRWESWRQAGLYVGRIIKGERPADLPIVQPTKFQFIINLRTAKAFGIEFPPSFQLGATEVIE